MSRKLTKEEKIMHTRIFVGLNRPEDLKAGIDAEYVKPSLDYMQERFPELDVWPVATNLWMALLQRGRPFNFSYWTTKLEDKCKREYNKQLTKLRRETLGLTIGDIVTDYNQPDPIEAPEIAWKEPLLEDEISMIEYLMDDLSQRDIYNMYKIHPSRQQLLRKSIKKKMEVI